MRRIFWFALIGILFPVAVGFSQESQSPVSPAGPELSASATPEPTPTPTATATPSPYPVRSVRISFVPPPLDGTISLGIYDASGKLIRVLHQQAALDEFTIGADALQTKWDGKDDAGQDLPAGKYHARGYAIGNIQLESLGIAPADATPPLPGTDKVSVKLMPNPLVKNDRLTVELTVGFDDTDSFLKTVDDLPLFVISERTDISKVAFIRTADKAIDVWQDSGAGTERFRLSKLDQMMAFDCGAFELK